MPDGSKPSALLIDVPAVASLEELTIGRVVGTGAAGRVHVAVVRRSGARCALKVIEKSRVAGEKDLARLLTEKEVLAAARDAPGVVRFFGTLQDATSLYFVLEYLDGGELLWHMRRTRRRSPATASAASDASMARPRCAHGIDAAAARIVTGSLVLALEHLSDHLSILYRDLKPTNCLFSRSGVLKLVDFGHAKRMSGASPRIDGLGASALSTEAYWVRFARPGALPLPAAV